MHRVIPFSFLPMSWGLQGKAREEAEARYTLEGYELDRRLVEINSEETDKVKAFADVDKAYGVITEQEWMKIHIMCDTDGVDQEVELVKLSMECGEIETREGEKKIADLLGEPWVAIVNEGLDQGQGPSGFYFEFDWNDHWITMLRQHGYEGFTEEELMEKWFTDVCRNEVIENGPIPFNSSSVVY